MNVFRFECRALRFKTLLWIVAIIAMVTMYTSIYPAFSKDVDTLRELFKNMPPAMQHVMGVGTMELFSFVGFFGNVFPFITLIGAIQAAVYGLGALSREPALGMSDFLLTKPQTRSRIFWQKIAAGTLALIITQAAVYTAAIGIAKSMGAGDFNTTQFAMFWGAFSLIQFFMFTLGLAISQVAKKLKATVPLALGLSFGFFLTSVLAVILGDDSVRWVTPFRFIDYKKIITDTAYDPVHLAYAFALIFIFTLTSYLIYTRKDVPASV